MKKICKFLSQFNAKSFVKNTFVQTVLFYSIGLFYEAPIQNNT